MNYRFFLAGLLSCLLVVSVASAFELHQVYITVDQQGNAVMDVTYQDNPAEYLGMKGLIATSSPFITNLQNQNANDLSKKNFQVACVEPGAAELVMPNFAQVNKKTITTSTIDLNQFAGKSPLSGGYQYPINLKADITIVFPDGYSVQQEQTSTIQGVTHTLQKTKTSLPPPLQQTCRKDKGLPLSGIIPDEVAPVAAVGASVAVTALGMTTFGSALSAMFAKLIVFLENTFGWVLQGRIAEKQKEERNFSKDHDRKLLLGFTPRELIVIGIGALVIGVLFYYAARLPLDPEKIAVFIIMGGIALMTHEIAHWYMNRKYQSTTEIQFWGMGAIIMAVTSWLFGSIFAQPTMTLVHEHVPLERRSLGIVMLSGPVLSVLIAFGCLLLIPLGGLFSTAGTIGFSINLLQAVFEMLPIKPCDGRDVYVWNKAVWAVVFMPLLLVYFIANL
jgi:Zn-dependent protease